MDDSLLSSSSIDSDISLGILPLNTFVKPSSQVETLLFSLFFFKKKKKTVVGRYLSVWANTPAFRSKSAFIWAEDGSSQVVFINAQLGHLVQLILFQPLILV
jgi:hypothetical protein